LTESRSFYGQLSTCTAVQINARAFVILLGHIMNEYSIKDLYYS